MSAILSSPPRSHRQRETKRWWALGALAVAMLTIGLDTTVLSVAVPTLATALHASNDQLQWFSAAYTLVLAAVLLPAGTLGDRFGRKKLLLGSMVVFGISSALCSWSTSADMLIGARAALGLGAAFMMPLSMAVLPTLFPDIKERGRAISIWVTATALGLPLGPILGGWLLDHFWWGSVFLINVPLVLVGVIAVAVLVPETSGGGTASVDLPGAALSSVGLLALTYGFIQAGSKGWGSLSSVGMIAAGVILLAGFLGWQARATNPLIQLNLFRHRGFSFGTALAVLSSFALLGLVFTLPQYFRAVLDTDALGTGVRLLPMIGGLVVGTRLAGKVAERVGRRAALVVGSVLLAMSMGGGALTSIGTSYGLSAIWITGVGVGIGFSLPTSMAIATEALDPATAGSGSALLQALRQVGGTIGVAVLGTVLSTAYRAHLSSVPEAVAAVVRSSVSAGVNVAGELGSAPLLDTVRSSFVHGMDLVLVVCGAITFGSAILALFYREHTPPRVPDGQGGAAQS